MDTDRAGDMIDRISICGIVFKFGNRTINWISRKHTYCSSVVYRSWVYSKFCFAESCVDAYVIERLRLPSERTNKSLREDSLSYIRFIKNERACARNKRLDVKNGTCVCLTKWYVRETKIQFEYCPSKQNKAGIYLTKQYFNDFWKSFPEYGCPTRIWRLMLRGGVTNATLTSLVFILYSNIICLNI